MARLIWTQESRRWLRDIYEYIARDSQPAARKVVRGIFDRAHLLLEFPEMGDLYQPRKFPNVRILLYGHYRVSTYPKPAGTSTFWAFSMEPSSSSGTSSRKASARERTHNRPSAADVRASWCAGR